MSPEMFAADDYSFGVDMWAFGVLFFRMLNQSFPFYIDVGKEPAEKASDLARRAQHFSYKKHDSTKSTPELEDLFLRIF